MENDTVKKTQTDVDVKRKAVKLVISHLKKKLPKEYLGSDYVEQWLTTMEELLAKPEFVLSEYFEMRRNLNGIIEEIIDEEIRFKIRDSWYSLGKALDKKVKRN
jgi:hypothetical protein